MSITSFVNLSAMPLYIVDPPDKITLLYRSLLTSIAQFVMHLQRTSWIPTVSIPRRCG